MRALIKTLELFKLKMQHSALKLNVLRRMTCRLIGDVLVHSMLATQDKIDPKR